MTGWDIFLKAMGSNPSSVMILILSSMAFVGYVFHLGLRIYILENTLSSGVTKEDLLQFEKRLIKELHDTLRLKSECELFHQPINEHLERIDKRIDQKADISLVVGKAK